MTCIRGTGFRWESALCAQPVAVIKSIKRKWVQVSLLNKVLKEIMVQTFPVDPRR